MCCKGVAVALAAIVLLIIFCSLIWVFVVRAEAVNTWPATRTDPYLRSFDEHGAVAVYENPPYELCGPQYHYAVLVVGNLLPSGEEDWWAWSFQSPCTWEGDHQEIRWHWDEYLEDGGIFYPKKAYILTHDGRIYEQIDVGDFYYVNWESVYLPQLIKSDSGWIGKKK